MNINMTQLIEDTTSKLLNLTNVLPTLDSTVLAQLDSEVTAATEVFSAANPDFDADGFRIMLVMKIYNELGAKV